MRGKVLFVAINTFTRRYLAQFPGLRGALMFVSDITPTTPDVVFLEPANEKYDATQVCGTFNSYTGSFSEAFSF